MKRIGFAAVALAAALTVACGGGNRDEADVESPDAAVGTGGTAPLGDPRAEGVGGPGYMGGVQNWVEDVAMHNAAEIELGKIASERGSSAQVKEFAQMMVREHTMAGNELKQAVSGQIQVPEQMDEEHRDLAQRLRGLQGMEFDREYMDAMVEGHEEVVDMLENRADLAGGDRPQAADAQHTEMAVNQWAAKTLPKVQQHLQRAQQLRDNLSRTATN